VVWCVEEERSVVDMYGVEVGFGIRGALSLWAWEGREHRIWGEAERKGAKHNRLETTV